MTSIATVPDPTAPLVFTSAYRQLSGLERTYVDTYVKRLESEADKAHEKISNSLLKAIPQSVIQSSRGMLEKPIVRAAITERVNQIATARELSIDKVVKELSSLAFSNMGDYIMFATDNEPYFDLSQCTPEQMAAIKTIKIEEKGVDGFARSAERKITFTLHDKVLPLTKLADMMGATTPDSPFWKAHNAKPRDSITTSGSPGDAYAAMIGN